MDTERKHPEPPADMVFEILARLPVRSLLRFKGACKSWSSLISSPMFQQYHNNLSQNNPLLFTIRKNNRGSLERRSILELSTYNLSGERLVNSFSKELLIFWATGHISRVPSCQGLVCLSSISGCRMFICNPSTHEILDLPPLEGFTYSIGFGYSSSTDKFKVVRSYQGIIRDQKRAVTCSVYTLGSSAWREVRLDSYPTFQWGCAPFVRDALHFLPYHECELDDDFIFVFDVTTEEWRRMRLPEQYYTHIRPFSRPRRLNELGGSLCLTMKLESAEQFEIWRLEDYRNSKWVKQYSIYSSSFMDKVSNWQEILIDPLAIMGDGSILMNVYCGMQSNVLCYNSEDNCYKEHKYGMPCDNICGKFVSPESLAILGFLEFYMCFFFMGFFLSQISFILNKQTSGIKLD